MLSHETIQELIPLYALGGLTRAEQDAVRAHLKDCAACRRLYQMERATVQMLPLGVEPVEPSSQAKRKLFARVDQDLAPAQPTHRERVVQPPPKRARFARPAFALAAVALVIALMVVGFFLFQNRTSPEQQKIAAIVGNPNVQTVTLAGTKDAPQASAQMYMVPGQSQAVLKINGLQPLPEDKTYEFWFIRGNDPHASNLFQVNPDGSVTLLVQADAQVQTFNAWGVSVEPRAGVTKPTGQIVILGGG